MKGSRPAQASLTRNTDLSKTKETQDVIENMVDGLNDHRISQEYLFDVCHNNICCCNNDW